MPEFRNLCRRFVSRRIARHCRRGGALGCLAVLPFNGFTAGILNWTSFSYLAFSLRVRPAIIASGVVFSLLMGMIGGLPPAVRAWRIPIITALREL